MPNDTSFTSITSGPINTCAISTEGRVYCWGDNKYGQLGNGNNISSNTPTEAKTPDNERFKFISTTEDSNGEDGSYIQQRTICGLTYSGNIYCWGYGRDGQTGSGSVSRNTPTKVSISDDKIKFNSISSSYNHTCATTKSGKAYCRGLARYGQIGVNSSDIVFPKPVIVSDAGEFKNIYLVYIKVGTYHTCSVSSFGQVYCWGHNDHGQIGNKSVGEMTKIPVKSQIPTDLKVKTISTVDLNSCALSYNGRVYCWGYGSNGALGNGSLDDIKTPTSIDYKNIGDKRLIYIYTTNALSISVDTEGKLYNWGIHLAGRANIDSDTNIKKNIPIEVFDTIFNLRKKTIY